MRVIWTMVRGIGLLVFLVAVLWGSLALWFRLPGPEGLRWGVALVFAALGLRASPAMLARQKGHWLAAFAVAFAALLLWWQTLEPATEGNWSPEVARQVTGTIEGDLLTLTNARDFTWRSESDVTESWVTDQYDLSQIESVDLFMSYWAGPAMAHLMLSFGFADGRYLAWSTEVRREVGKSFSPVADFFKENPLSIVAGSEHDIVGLRTNTQMSDVVLYRLRGEPAAMRRLLEGYVARANGLSETPEFFHSLFTNCSRTVVTLARALGADLPVDWRVLVNGYFPEYLYAKGSLDTSRSFEALTEAGRISERARAHGLRDGYSEAIRAGMPGLTAPEG